jgi:hypothetical protein
MFSTLGVFYESIHRPDIAAIGVTLMEMAMTSPTADYVRIPVVGTRRATITTSNDHHQGR